MIKLVDDKLEDVLKVPSMGPPDCQKIFYTMLLIPSVKKETPNYILLSMLIMSEVVCVCMLRVISESPLLAKYVYTYKEFDCGFSLLSMLCTVPRTLFSKIDRNRLTAKNKDNKAEQR